MTKILVPLDLSRSTQFDSLIAMVKAIAAIDNAKIHLLHVVEPIDSFVRGLIPEEMIRKRKYAITKELEETAVLFGAPGNVTCASLVGHPAEGVLKYAKGIAADMIIMPARDPDDVGFLLGSVAGRIVRRAHCSVLVHRS